MDGSVDSWLVSAGRVEIVSGIAEGESVILVGKATLTDGQPVLVE